MNTTAQQQQQQQQGKTIQVEYLGASVRALLAKLRGFISSEDETLLTEYISVVDLARIFEKLSSSANKNTGGEEEAALSVWNQLKPKLEARRNESQEKMRAVTTQRDELRRALDAEEEESKRSAEAEAQRLLDEQAEREKRARKRAKRAAKAAAAAQAAEEEAERERIEAEAREAELAAIAEEEQRAAEAAAEEERRARKRAKKAAKLQRLQEEADALAEQEAQMKRKRNLNEEWANYKLNHPLFVADDEIQSIDQTSHRRGPATDEDLENTLLVDRTPAAPADTQQLLARSYTPKCPNCGTKFSVTPKGWDCPLCLRKFNKVYKTWQPDSEASTCGSCKVSSLGRFSRHHCRSCGRVVCGKCSGTKASIPALGTKEAVKVCKECVSELGQKV